MSETDRCRKAPLPEGYRYADDGSIEHVGKDGTDWSFLCSRLEVVALTRDDKNESWGRLLAIHDRDGVPHMWAMPMSMLSGNCDGVRAHLYDLGLEIAPEPAARKALEYLLNRADPQRTMRCVDRLGWHGGVFVLPDRTIGPVDGEEVVYQPTIPSRHAVSGRGSLSDWREAVAQLCVGNSRLVFGLSAALAAPLLRPSGMESGGFHFRGQSSTGKTTTLLVAGSVWGPGGKNGYIRSWRSTDNGVEGTAAAHSDRLLCLDEMSQVAPEAAGETAFMLANEQGKQRAGKDGSPRPVAAWKVLFLSTGEIGLEAKIGEGRQPRRLTAGQEVRIVDIPADAGAGFGIFDKVPPGMTPPQLAIALGESTERVYGTAGPAFVEMLVEGRDEAAELTRQFVERFVAEVAADADGQVQRVARRFGLVAAAGELAVEWGIFPFPGGDAIAAAKRCFNDWLAARGTTGPAEIARGLAQVREFIQQHGSSRFAPWKDPDHLIIRRAGYVRKDGEGTRYYVFPETWRNEVCQGLDAEAIARECAKRGILEVGKDSKPQKCVRISKLPKQRRMYVIDEARLNGEDGDE